MWLLVVISEIPSSPHTGFGTGFRFIDELVASSFTVLYFLFWIWMLIHCFRTEPDRQFWIWILIIAQPIGTLAYFFLRYLPSREFSTPWFLRRWTRGRQLARLETAASQIGNPHQYIQWGNALRDVGLLDRANEAFHQALKKDAQNIQALWGAAQVASHQKRFGDVRSLTRQILDQDSQYKFGDVSLEHGRALKELGDTEGARRIWSSMSNDGGTRKPCIFSRNCVQSRVRFGWRGKHCRP